MGPEVAASSATLVAESPLPHAAPSSIWEIDIVQQSPEAPLVREILSQVAILATEHIHTLEQLPLDDERKFLPREPIAALEAHIASQEEEIQKLLTIVTQTALAQNPDIRRYTNGSISDTRYQNLDGDKLTAALFLLESKPRHDAQARMIAQYVAKLIGDLPLEDEGRREIVEKLGVFGEKEGIWAHSRYRATVTHALEHNILKRLAYRMQGWDPERPPLRLRSAELTISKTSAQGVRELLAAKDALAAMSRQEQVNPGTKSTIDGIAAWVDGTMNEKGVTPKIARLNKRWDIFDHITSSTLVDAKYGILKQREPYRQKWIQKQDGTWTTADDFHRAHEHNDSRRYQLLLALENIGAGSAVAMADYIKFLGLTSRNIMGSLSARLTDHMDTRIGRANEKEKILARQATIFVAAHGWPTPPAG